MEACVIPSMGADRIADWLTFYAATAPGEIVEIGAWLGHGTEIMAKATTKTIHVYDRFQANPSEVKKARDQRIALQDGQDTLPIVRSWLPENVNLTKGRIKDAKWNGKTIGLLVDDASKSHSFDHVVDEFFPYLADGAAVIMMDHNYPPCENQRGYFSGHEGMEKIADRGAASLFIYHEVTI